MPVEHASEKKFIAPEPLTVSPWVNEPYPSLGELLSAHDVARLTRRPRWMLMGLGLIGQFPRRRRLRGQWVGWYRFEVLEWIARNSNSMTASATPTARYHQPPLLLDEFARDTVPSNVPRALACTHR
jgi:predicted DNA-binding transcriptional regulator AlpA